MNCLLNNDPIIHDQRVNVGSFYKICHSLQLCACYANATVVQTRNQCGEHWIDTPVARNDSQGLNRRVHRDQPSFPDSWSLAESTAVAIEVAG